MYEKSLWNYVSSIDPTLGNSLFGAVKLVKMLILINTKYSWYGFGFDMKGTFSFPSGVFGKNIIIFGVDMSSSVYVDNKKKDILNLGGNKVHHRNRWLNSDCRKKYSINFTESRKKFCLSMHYNGASSYLFVNDVEIHKFKAKNS